MFENLSQNMITIWGISTLFFLLLGMVIGRITGKKSSDIELTGIEEPISADVIESKDLAAKFSWFRARIDAYRKALASMKTMGFTSKKKQAEFIYALILENEAFEQLLLELSKKNPHEKSGFISEQLEQIQLRRRFLERIFDDDIMIKQYVRESLFNRKKVTKIEMSKKSGAVFGTIAQSNTKQKLDVV